MGLVSLQDSFANMPSPILPENTVIQFVLEIKNPLFLENAALIKVKYIRDDWHMGIPESWDEQRKLFLS